MKRLLVMLALSLLLVGCLEPNRPKPPKPPPPPPPDVLLRVTLLPVITSQADGNSRWDDNRINLVEYWVNKLWAEAGVQFEFLDPVHTDPADGLYSIDSQGEWLQLSRDCMNYYRRDKAIAIYLVDDILWPGNGISGIANYPSNGYSDQLYVWQFGIAMTYDATPAVAAHELGHAFNLMHIDEGQSPELAECRVVNDCDEFDVCGCNIMSYCLRARVTVNDGAYCAGMYFVDSALPIARSWMLSPQRRDAVTVLNDSVLRQRMNLRYTGKTEPVIDP